MTGKFNYSQDCFEKIKKYFDQKFGQLPFEVSEKVKYLKYLDSDKKVNIVSFYNDNKFAKSEYDLDFENLHIFLNTLKANENSQIHIVCDSYIASVREGNYFRKLIDDKVAYYYLTSDFVSGLPIVENITQLLLGLKRDYFGNLNKRFPRKSKDDFHDPYSEKNIMRDLMNGEGEKHGF